MPASFNAYGYYTRNVGRVPPDHGLLEISATQKAPLGHRIQFDGRTFYYARAGGTALAPGKLCKAGYVSDHINKAVAATANVGTYNVTLTTASASTTCTEGYLQINDAAGEGIQYKIKEAAANATTATSTDLVLYDAIATQLTTSSEATILYHPLAYVTVCSAITDIIVGVPPVTVTADYYFWLQTWGPACVLSEGVPAAGTVVEVGVGSNEVAGTTTCNADTALGVGVQMLVGVTTEYKPVMLRITP